MATIAPGRCFLPHRDGRVDFVVNWNARRTAQDPLVIIPLSPRHRAIWRALRRRQRSEKSILYALFAQPTRQARRLAVPINLERSSETDLARLAEIHLGVPIPRLARLGRPGLLALVRSLYQAYPTRAPTPN